MQWTLDRINAVQKSSLWAGTVIFVTWDDWGGWYDHVDAPLKDTWKGGGPSNEPYTGSQFSYGPRVPCLVVSPYAKKGYISKTFHSHVSLIKFCETTFGLAALNARDSAADDMADCFNFQAAPSSTPAPQPLPKPAPTPPPAGPPAAPATPPVGAPASPAVTPAAKPKSKPRGARKSAATSKPKRKPTRKVSPKRKAK